MLTDYSKENMLDWVRQNATHVSLHYIATGNPDSSGSGEVSGSGYGRIAVTEASFTVPSADSLGLSSNITFSGTVDDPVSHMGLWNGTLFMGSGPLSGALAFDGSGEYAVNTATRIRIDD